MRTAVLFAVAAMAIPASPAGAAADGVTCTFDDAIDRLTVEVAGNFTGRVVRSGIEIKVFDAESGGTNVPCTGPTPTVRNTDTIAGFEQDVNAQTSSVFVIDLSEGRFAPGDSDEQGSSDEVEFTVGLGNGFNDDLVVKGGAATETIRLGAADINLNAGEATGVDGDFIAISGVEGITVAGGAGEDELSAIGGLGTGAPADRRVRLKGGGNADRITGGDDDDVLFGENGGDRVAGGKSGDALLGGFGPDVLIGGLGGDTFAGEDGIDTASFATAGLGVDVDLALTTRQDTGLGNDRFDDVENVVGSRFGDDLLGDGLPNRLEGRDGNDFLRGRGADDVLDGGDNADDCDGGLGDDTVVNCEF